MRTSVLQLLVHIILFWLVLNRRPLVPQVNEPSVKSTWHPCWLIRSALEWLVRPGVYCAMLLWQPVLPSKERRCAEQKKEKLDEEKCSQDKVKVCFHGVGGQGANVESLASLSVCFRKVLKSNVYITCECHQTDWLKLYPVWWIIADPACWHHILEGGCVARQMSVMSAVSSSSGAAVLS